MFDGLFHFEDKVENKIDLVETSGVDIPVSQAASSKAASVFLGRRVLCGLRQKRRYPGNACIFQMA
jgi:hypothetical protein